MLLCQIVDAPCRSRYFLVLTTIFIFTKSYLEHCHDPCLKSEAVFHGEQEMEPGDIDLTLLFIVNVPPVQISQIMELLKGLQTSGGHINSNKQENRGDPRFCPWPVT
jgi:hypothetical protein